MNKIISVVLVACGILATGCASIVDGKYQTISFSTNPEGATVTLNGQQVGKTPVTLPVQRMSGPGILRFTKEGYKDSEVIMHSSLNTWFLGNFIFGGLLGSTTDAVTGAMHEYQPGSYMATLTPTEAAVTLSGLSNKQKVVSFIVVTYGSLIVELNNKPGQYLASLFALSSIPANRQAEMKIRLKALSEAYLIIPEFADAAADMLLK